MSKIEDIKIVSQMISIYCRKKHKTKKGELCASCTSLLKYATIRRTYCPFGEEKAFCSHCPVHCYRRDKREEIRMVMRYAGPWMLVYNPKMAIKHMHETVQHKRKLKKIARTGTNEKTS